MSRAVGGASAVGCGVFGLGGIIISVGLVFWLSSMALPGSGGSDGDGSDPVATVAPTVPAGAAIALDPSGPVPGEGRAVEVTGTGFGPQSVVVTICLAHPPEGTVDPCDAAAQIGAEVDAGGWTTSFPVPRTITVAGITYDCAAAAGGCQLLAHLDHSADGPTAPITFAGGLPPIADAEPAPAA